MNSIEFIRQISAKDVEVDRFVHWVIEDDALRDELICQMIANPAIMVYYHCYTVADKASQTHPELFYRYWDDIAPLLEHKNSYHRDIALTLLANLTSVDHENRFSGIFQAYFEHIHDQKFMTGKCCVQNSLKILRNRPELRNKVLAVLLDVNRRCAYPEKQKELLKSDVLSIFANMHAELSGIEGVGEFIRACTGSISPKTRNMARELIRQYA